MIFPKTVATFRGHALGFATTKAIATREPAVTRNNVLYLVIGALAVTAAVLGYQVYKDRHQPQGVHIDLGPGGLKIEGK
jgi:RsiW-degrading membrane proteinase PrsW (M82 family)